MNRLVMALSVGAALFLLGGEYPDGVGIDQAEAQALPTCTNGDCPPPPPDCTNGDCPPPPPDCSNGDCPPPEGTDACCCVGDNQPGDIRVCCCPNETLDGMTCRQSLVLDTGYPDNWHQVIAQESLEGKRPRFCDLLMPRLCDPPEQMVCTLHFGQQICMKVVKAQCKVLQRLCLYRFCGPEWFPFEAPTPDKASCGWWERIDPCTVH